MLQCQPVGVFVVNREGIEMEITHIIKQLIPSRLKRFIRRRTFPLYLIKEANKRGLSLHNRGLFLEIVNDNNVIRISQDHLVYLYDIIISFDYYFRAVTPFFLSGMNIVDYSSPRYHDVVGFDAFPVMFPSFAEPVITAFQYIEFAQLSLGMTVIDLGAYSGLTSILFSQAVGKQGSVVAVDPDPVNLHCIHRNISRYNKYQSSSIKIIEGAIWKHSNGIDFSCEGNMGASASSIVGVNRGRISTVRSFTLSDIVNIAGLNAVDFIKCDVEGAESVVFEDRQFFNSFLPRIIVEPHIVDGRLSSDKIIADLSPYGYTCEIIQQEGVKLPLLQCIPTKI